MAHSRCTLKQVELYSLRLVRAVIPQYLQALNGAGKSLRSRAPGRMVPFPPDEKARGIQQSLHSKLAGGGRKEKKSLASSFTVNPKVCDELFIAAS